MINKGENYLHIVGKWKGDLNTFAQHMVCAEACMHIRDAINDGCIPFGGLLEYWREVRRDNYRDSRHEEKWIKLRSLMARVLILYRDRPRSVKHVKDRVDAGNVEPPGGVQGG